MIKRPPRSPSSWVARQALHLSILITSTLVAIGVHDGYDNDPPLGLGTALFFGPAARGLGDGQARTVLLGLPATPVFLQQIRERTTRGCEHANLLLPLP